jgi:hypothetical protein
MHLRHAARTCRNDLQHGHAVWTCTMDMQDEHACSKDVTMNI